MLTAGVDALIGSAGNDTFSAPTAEGTTIQAGDSIDGGLGNDTLILALTATANNTLAGLTVKGVETVTITGAANLGTGAPQVAEALAARNAAAVANSAANAKLTLADARAAAAVAVADAQDIAEVTALKEITAADFAVDFADAGFTRAQLISAATAALKSATGATLSTDEAVTARAFALATAASTVADDASEAVALSDAELADATAEYDALVSVQGVATVSAAQFINATAISVDGTTASVTGIANGQTITLAAAGAISSTVTGAGTLTYAAGTTAATIGLTNTSGTITLDDASTTTPTTTLKTVNINGSVFRSAAADLATNKAALPGTLTVKDDLGTSSTETITTVNLGITSAAVVNLDDLSKLVTVDGSASTGALSITLDTANSAKLATVKSGAGNDVLSVTLSTDENGLDGAKSAIVSGGAGNDRITVTDDGTGAVRVNGDDGNDTFVIDTTDLGNTLVIDGGAGIDKIKLSAADFELSEGELVSLADLTSIERAEFVNVATLDASDVSQFTQIDLGSDTQEVMHVANSQTINVNAEITANITADGYIALGSEEADELDTPITATKYAGALTVNTTADATLAVMASSLTLNVANASSVAAGSVGDQTDTIVELSGDVKTLTVNMTAGNNFVTRPTDDVISSIDIVVTSIKDDEGNFTSLGNMTSLTLKGVGDASVDNSNDGNGVTKLVNIDASGLGGTKTALFNDDVADLPLGGLFFTGNIDLAETVKLGAGQDTIVVASKSTKLDTITGFKLVSNKDDTLNTDMSDSLVIDATASEWIAYKANETLSLNANLVAIAAKTGLTDPAKYDNVVFQYKGDTYVFSEGTTENTVLDATDTVIKLTGSLDLDLLAQAIVNPV